MAHELSINDEGKAEMFSLRESPWHKLGTVLKNPPTAEEALRAAKLGWPVQLDKMYRKNEFGELLAVDSFRLITRGDNGRVLGLATENYTPLQNAVAFEIFNPLVDNGFAEFTTAGALHGGRNVWVMIKLNITDPRVTDILGDEVVPYAMVDNSHSGTRSVRLTETPLRVVCQNTLLGATRAATRSIKLIHNRSVESNLTNAAKELWRDLIDNYAAIARDFATLKSKFLDEAMFRALVLEPAVPVPTDKSRYSTDKSFERAVIKAETKQLEISALWDGGDGHKGDRSAWEAYNAYTQWFDHVRTSRADYASTALDGQTIHATIFNSLMHA